MEPFFIIFAVLLMFVVILLVIHRTTGSHTPTTLLNDSKHVRHYIRACYQKIFSSEKKD